MKRTVLLLCLGFTLSTPAIADVNDGLIAYYPLDGNAIDASTNGAHGSNYTGTVTYGPGKRGQAAWFNGQSCILLPQPRLLDGASNATLSAWICFSGSGGGQILGAGDSRSGSDPISTRINPSAAEDVHFAQVTDPGPPGIGFSIGDRIPGLRVGEWHLFTLTLERQATQSVFRCYVDTALVKQVTDSSFYRISYDVDMPSLIGAIQADGPWQYWFGGIDDLRIYDRALSKAEISYLVNGGDATLTINVSQVRICWNPPAGKTSQLQYRSDETGGQWLNLNAPITETGTQICVTNEVAGPGTFYRVLYLP